MLTPMPETREMTMDKAMDEWDRDLDRTKAIAILDLERRLALVVQQRDWAIKDRDDARDVARHIAGPGFAANNPLFVEEHHCQWIRYKE